MTAEASARHAKLVLWDFDGVIKESVDVKTHAFVHLFASHGARVAGQVKAHHEANGGMSRFQKIPIYLRYSGEEPTDERVRTLCERFGQLVRQGVIDAPWVPGVEPYLRNNPQRQIFIVVSATPQQELEDILHALDLHRCFNGVVGAPTSKTQAIGWALRHYGISPHESVMIGDARADFDAAASNHVPFLLRRHTTNAHVFGDYHGPSITDMTE